MSNWGKVANFAGKELGKAVGSATKSDDNRGFYPKDESQKDCGCFKHTLFGSGSCWSCDNASWNKDHK